MSAAIFGSGLIEGHVFSEQFWISICPLSSLNIARLLPKHSQISLTRHDQKSLFIAEIPDRLWSNAEKKNKPASISVVNSGLGFQNEQY